MTMGKSIIYIALILAMMLFPVWIFCAAGYIALDPMTTGEFANTLAQFATKVDNGELNYQEIAQKLNGLSSGEKQVAEGFSLLQQGLFYFGFIALVISIVQGYLVYYQFKKNNAKH